MNLLLLEPGERRLGPRDPRARHILRVLRLNVGDTVRAGEIGGAIGSATIASVVEGVSLTFSAQCACESLSSVTLILGHPRPIVLRRMLRDLAAIGPARIIVTPTALGEKSYLEANLWDDVRAPMLEGASQGGSTLLPELLRAASLHDAIDIANDPGAAYADGPAGRVPVEQTRVVLHVGFEARPIPLSALLIGARAVVIAVGSERGWTDDELALFGRASYECGSLGPRTLRTETAAAIAVWAATAALGANESEVGR